MTALTQAQEIRARALDSAARLLAAGSGMRAMNLQDLDRLMDMWRTAAARAEQYIDSDATVVTDGDSVDRVLDEVRASVAVADLAELVRTQRAIGYLEAVEAARDHEAFLAWLGHNPVRSVVVTELVARYLESRVATSTKPHSGH